MLTFTEGAPSYGGAGLWLMGACLVLSQAARWVSVLLPVRWGPRATQLGGVEAACIHLILLGAALNLASGTWPGHAFDVPHSRAHTLWEIGKQS